MQIFIARDRRTGSGVKVQQIVDHCAVVIVEMAYRCPGNIVEVELHVEEYFVVPGVGRWARGGSQAGHGRDAGVCLHEDGVDDVGSVGARDLRA